MWTVSREADSDPRGTDASLTMSAIRSDDGAVLVHRGNTREGGRLFDYKRGDLSLALAGTQYEGNEEEVTGTFTVHLSSGLRVLAGRHPDRDAPTASAIAQARADIAEAIPAWGWQIASDVPITEVVFV